MSRRGAARASSIPTSSRRCPTGIDVPGTEIHIFYALKMGEKYRARYLQHFARPVIHELDLQHEELLVRFPERWAALVREIITKGGTTR